MKNINVTIKCCYNLVKSSELNKSVVDESDNELRSLSVEGCKMAWKYLLSDIHFEEVLKSKMGFIKESVQRTGQTLKELRINVLFNDAKNSLLVDLDIYTEEGGHQSLLAAFEKQFDDINSLADTAKQGQVLKAFILKEINKLRNKMLNRLFIFFGAGFLIAVVIWVATFEDELQYAMDNDELGRFGLYCILSVSPILIGGILVEYFKYKDLSKELFLKLSSEEKERFNTIIRSRNENGSN